MPRIARGLVDGFIYHVHNRGNGRQEIFHSEKDYEAFIDLMEKADEGKWQKVAFPFFLCDKQKDGPNSQPEGMESYGTSFSKIQKF